MTPRLETYRSSQTTDPRTGDHYSMAAHDISVQQTDLRKVPDRATPVTAVKAVAHCD
jgi:hypothetical protein